MGLANPLHIVTLLIVFVIFWIGPAVLVARLAARRGRCFACYLVAGLIFGWIFSAILAVFILIRPAR
jgi:threonine/homoserine/homoserine lactone efflux protein